MSIRRRNLSWNQLFRIGLLAVCVSPIALYQSSASAAQTTTTPLPKGVTLLKKGTVVPGTPEAELYAFDNGLKLLFLPDNRSPLATIRIHLAAGSARERQGITGLAHFFEHMMFRKTKDQPEGAFDATLSGIGGSGNAGTSTDYVVYHTVFPGPALDIMIDLERRRFLELDLQDPYFTTEKGAVISERKLRYENNPEQRGLEFIRRITERGTPREWMTIGAKEDVETMSIEAARTFYKTYYVPSNTLISVGGPFRSDEVVNKIHQAFSSWQGSHPPELPPLPQDLSTRDAGKSFICRESVSEQTFRIVFPSTDTSYDDAIYSYIFSQLLDDSPEGSLSRRLVNANLATSFGFVKTYWQKGPQPHVAYFSLSADQKIESLINRFQQEVKEAASKKWDRAFRNVLQKRIDLEKAEAAERMTTLIENYEWNQTNYDDFLISKRFQKIVDELSVAKLQNWIQKNIQFEKAYFLGVTGNTAYPSCSDLTVDGVRS